MAVPVKELEHYRTYIKDENAIDDLCEVMQNLFYSVGKETIKYCREYLTLIKSDNIKELSFEQLKTIIKHIYKTTFRDYSAGYESLEEIDYVLPSEYTLNNTCKNQLSWLYLNYKHNPVTYSLPSDSFSVALAVTNLREKIESILH